MRGTTNRERGLHADWVVDGLMDFVTPAVYVVGLGVLVFAPAAWPWALPSLALGTLAFGVNTTILVWPWVDE